MPADAGAGRVFGDENLLKLPGAMPAKPPHWRADRAQKSGMSSVLVRPPPLKS